MLCISLFTILVIPSILCNVNITCEIKDIEFETGTRTKTCMPSSFVIQNDTEIVNITNGNENIQGFYVENSKSDLTPLGLSTSFPALKYFIFKKSTLTKISQNSLKNLQELIEVNLYKNLLTKIEAGTFSDNQKLQKINLSFNKIKFIDPCAFSGLYNLQELHLNDNELKTIETGLFQNNQNLLVIKLQMNGIERLPVTLFHGLNKLNTVSLDYNELQAIPDRMFVDNEDLKMFTVSSNSIRIIGAEVRNTLEALDVFKIDNNNCIDNSESYEDFSLSRTSLDGKCEATCEDYKNWLELEINENRNLVKCEKIDTTTTTLASTTTLTEPPTTESSNDFS
ncbi:hypothetical protein ACKWTF_016330 [Chironomus riparius]